MMTHLKRHGPWVLISIWLCALLYAFFYFFYAEYRSFFNEPPEKWVEFDQPKLEKALMTLFKRESIEQNGKYTLIHFWNSDCQCDLFNQAHVQRLIAEYGPKGIQFVIVTPKKDTDSFQTSWHEELNNPSVNIQTLVWDGGVPGVASAESLIQVTPAAVVIDRLGAIQYYGPYALGGICKADENGIIETLLNRLLEGKGPLYPYVAGFGCYCEWPAN